MGKVSVKVQYQEDIRRVSFEEKPSFNALYQLLKNLFVEAQLERFSIKYSDDEGDLISVTNDREIAEAWEFANESNNGFLRLKLTVDASARAPVAAVNNTTPQPTTTSSTTTSSTTSTPSTPQQQTTTTTSKSVTEFPAELISQFIEKVLAEVQKLQNASTAPEVKQLLSNFNLEELMRQFQPVLQQFTSQGYPAQLYANRSHIASSVTSTVENDFYTHVLPLLSSFGVVHDILPKINAASPFSNYSRGSHHRSSSPKPSTTTTTTTNPSPVPTQSIVEDPVPVPVPVSVKERIMSSRLIKDVTIEDGTQIEIKSKFIKTWTMENNGNVAWEKQTKLVFVQGDLPCGEISESVEVGTVQPGNQIDVSVAMTAPSRPGRYISNFRLVDSQGNKFGHRIWVDIVVIEPEFAEVQTQVEVKEKEVEIEVEIEVEKKKDENEEKYETLESMGFFNRKLNERLLAKYRGDLVMTINELCSL